MSCPIDVITGFIQLTGPIPQTTLNSQKQTGPHLLELSIGPTSTPPSISVTNINDINNECYYNGKKYISPDIKICKLLHSGYILPGMSGEPSAEMIISFSGSDPSGILLCFPLFTGRAENDTYLNQVIDKPDTTSITTLDSIFVNQPSLAYKTCFEMQDHTVKSGELYVFVFPKGIHLSDQQYQKLMKITGTLPAYTLSPAIRNMLPTVNKSTIVNGLKQVITTSTEGQIPIVPVATCDKEFEKKFQYFIEAPKIRSTSTSKSTSTTRPTSQYKCVPLNKYVKVSNKDKSLEEVLRSYDETKKVNTSNSMSDPKNILIMESVIAGAIALTAMAGLAYVIYKILPD
jgi:hypothetical protein